MLEPYVTLTYVPEFEHIDVQWIAASKGSSCLDPTRAFNCTFAQIPSG